MSKKEDSKKKKAANINKDAAKDADAAKTVETENDGNKKDDASNTEQATDNNEAEKTESTEDIDSKKDSKDPKDKVIEELQDRVKRQMAEFDNFRKRTEKEKSAMFEMGASDIIKKLLPIVDNFERGFKSITDEEKETAFAKGMDMVYKQTVKMLEDAGVKAIDAVGKEFDPEFHNAVMHVDDDSVDDNIIVEEFEKGSPYKDSVIRHSMVKVAN